MFLSKIKLVNFKNYSNASLHFDHKINIVFGDNGSGKTNFLDAIHFLSVSKSYFGLSDKYLIKDEEDYYRLEGYYKKNDKSDHLVIKYKINRKRDINLNLKRLERVNDLIGRFPVVLIAPDDIGIVKGNSKDRRDYFNKWLCQSNRKYLDGLITYNRLLRQKDALLKADRRPSALAVESFNHKMVPLAEFIHQSINEALLDFEKNVYTHYNLISHGREEMKIIYHSDLKNVVADKLFAENIQQEIMMKRPLVGIQKDEYEFLMNGNPLKKYGSQGQIKSWLYALRLAEFDYLKQSVHHLPILILDDFFEKLDRSRLSAMMNLINSDQFGQVFLSDTEISRAKDIFDERGISFAAYSVVEGEITQHL